MAADESVANSPKRVIKAGSYSGKGIAVFTSGGDSQGEKILLKSSYLLTY